jgi:hypothetical protein
MAFLHKFVISKNDKSIKEYYVEIEYVMKIYACIIIHNATKFKQIHKLSHHRLNEKEPVKCI